MARAKYQVLVLPYTIDTTGVRYCVFHRSDMDVWQFIADGGEDEDNSILVSAKREAFEEAGIPMDTPYHKLETQCSISTECFERARKLWGEDCLVIPEYSFAVEVLPERIKLSHEHTIYEWLDYETAVQRLKYDSNKVALWELDNKIRLGLLHP